MSVASGHYTQRVLSTIFLVSFGTYLFLATVTYTPFDPGWMHVSSETEQVSNASGIAGAWLADMLYAIFGWAALLLPLFLFTEALQVWWPRSYLIRPFRYAAQFFILLTTSALLYFLWQVPSDALVNASGGIIGYELGQSLANILSTVGAVIFLVLFSFILWTLVFRIEWLKTGGLLRATPQYLQELFYKNVPPETVLDLTMQKKTAENVTITEDVSEHTPAPTQNAQQDEILLQAMEQQKQHDAEIREIEQKIVAQPKAVPSNAAQDTLRSGEVWRAQAVAEPTTEKVADITLESIEQSTEIDHSTTLDVAVNQQDNLPDSHDEIAQLIQEADRQLQDGAERKVSTEMITPVATTTSILDWSDDEIFDELLAAVPQQSSTVSKSQVATEEHTQTPVSQVTPVAQHSDVTTQAMHENSTSVAITAAGTVPATLSKAEFIEEWQNTAGKPTDDEFDWDDLDAPLTDASGRVMSRAMQVAERRKDLSPLPSWDLLDPVDPNKKVSFSAEQLARLSELLEIKLQDFNIKATVVEAQPGPVVTRFELDLAPGVKASKVTNISRDLARSMSMASVRVVEVIPGKPYIGIEVPNNTREMVRLIELLETPAYRDPNALLSMAMGKDISGNPVLADLAKAPHMLVAGTTGSGKSVAVNAMLLSMLLKYTPEQLRLIMIDPKQLELANYNDIPHLLTPVVTDMKDAVSALNWCVNEMERRYKLMSLMKVRKLSDFNRKIEDAMLSGEDLIDPTWKASDSATQERAPRLQPMPLIVIVADEFADMIMQVGKKAEEMITRLAQKSRAAGIHLLLATQRPTVDVVTGLIKANIPTRAALRVNSKLDSRTILDAGGAEDMLGHGDMLFLGPGKIEPERVHGAFISDDEVNRICDAWRERGSPDYVDEILTPFDEEPSARGFEDGDGGTDRDVLYDQCVAFVLESRKVSVSSLQRKFSLGYNRAARIVDQMQEQGIVSEQGANGKREILV